MHSGSIRFRGEEIGGQNAFAIVRKGLALSPEGWRLFVQQSVENNLLLGATPLHDKSRTSTLLERVYEIFPQLEGAPQPARRHHVRRRAADAGGRPRADERSETADAGRAVARARAGRGGSRCTRRSAGCTGEGLTILLAEQSIELALEVSDFATVLQVGKSVLSGTAAALAQDPQVQHAYLGGA